MIDWTTIVGIDQSHLPQWRLTWPTWRRHRPELLERPLTIFYDAAEPEEEWHRRLQFVDHPNRRLVPWNLSATTQREKMLNGFVFVGAQVTTPWYLKLDVDVVAGPHRSGFEEAWFQADERGQSPVFVSSPWSYTKPADMIERLEAWSSTVPALSARPSLGLHAVPGAERLSHRRIISYCFFGNTQWTREMAGYCRERLPVASQDTFLWFCAAKRGDFFRRVRFAHYGWSHVHGLRRLSAAVDRSLQAGLSSHAVSQPPQAPQHAQSLIRLFAALPQSQEGLQGAEVGVAAGTTSAALLRGLPSLKLTMVDSWATFAEDHPYRRSGDRSARLSAKRQNQYEREARIQTGFAAERRTVIHSDSLSAAQQTPDGSLDFVFIDADHTYEAVQQDIQVWWPKVRSGGLLCGHDYNSPRDRRGIWGVARAVNEFAAERSLQPQIMPGNVWYLPKPAATTSITAPIDSATAPANRERGVVFLLTGPGHGVRLVVALHHLRRYWSGPVTVFTTHPTSHDIGRRCAADQRLNVDHRTCELFPVRRNASYVTKSVLMQSAPYDECVFMDADTLVVGPFTELFDALQGSPLAVTRFANWTTSLRRIRRRIGDWRKVVHADWPAETRDRQLAAAIQDHPAINTGVLAFRRDAEELRRWRDLTCIGWRRFICDEIALQILLPELSATIMDCRFNCSPVYAQKMSDVRIWHFHGDKHLRDARGREIWFPAYAETLRLGIADVGTWGSEIDHDLARFATEQHELADS